MSTKGQVQTQAKTPAAPAAAGVRQPPVAVSERELEQPNIAMQLEGAARLGHSLGAISVDGAAPSQTQAWPLIPVDEALSHKPKTICYPGATPPELAVPKAVVQRRGTYEPVEIDKGQPAAIAELEYAEANKIKFTTITSCIGLIGCKGEQLVAVHLALLDKNDTSVYKAGSPDLDAAVGACMEGCDPVFLIGETGCWEMDMLERIKSAAGGVTYVLGLGSGVYEALSRGDGVVIWHEGAQVWPYVGSMLPEWPPGVGQELAPEEELQTKPASGAQRQGWGAGSQLDDETAGCINRARGGGQPLDSVIQAQMAETMGHDFNDLRVHTDAEADALNQQLSAKAFTTGRDIFFKRGAYEPGSSSGRELIAHEVSHVVQQAQGRVKPTMQMNDGVPVNDDWGLEHEADVMGAKALHMRRADHVTFAPIAQVKTLQAQDREATEESEVPGAAIGTFSEKGRLDFLSSTHVTQQADGNKPKRQLGEDEDEIQMKPVIQCQLEAERMQLLEDRGELFVEALLNLFEGPDVEGLVSAAWDYVRQGILAMWGEDRELGSEFFEAAARQLAPLLPQPEQMGDGAIALWSGSIEATAIKAQEYAEKQGFTTLETTEVGRVLEMLQLGDVIEYWPDTRPLWVVISKQYASLPKSGEVHIFAAARHNITQILNSLSEEQPILISTELAELQEKHDQLVQIGGAGITPVWHVLGFDENMEIRPIDIDGHFDDLATHNSLEAAREAMEMYITLGEN